MEASGHEAREVGHVDPERSPDLVGDLAERGEVEVARVRGPPRDDDPRIVLERPVAHQVHVDDERLGIDAVGDGVVELAREVQLHAVGEVATVRELEAENGVARSGDRREHRRVRGGSGVRLHVRVRGAEERLRPLDRERLGDVDELAAAVVAAAGVALGVLVREHRALGLQHGDGNEVLARDHLEVIALSPELEFEHFGDLGIDLGQRGIQHRLGTGGFGQDWLLHDIRT